MRIKETFLVASFLTLESGPLLCKQDQGFIHELVGNSWPAGQVQSHTLPQGAVLLSG